MKKFYLASVVGGLLILFSIQPSEVSTAFLPRPKSAPKLPEKLQDNVVEQLVLVDYTWANLFNNDHAKMKEHLDIFFGGVNTVFSQLRPSGLSIRFVIKAFKVMSSRESDSTVLPFIEGREGNPVNADKALGTLGKWAVGPKSPCPECDMVLLLTAREVISGGQAQQGLALTGGACKKSSASGEARMQGVAIVRADDTYFYRFLAVAHELAHTLGATHDGGDDGDPLCPREDGYIMSAEGYGTSNKIKFSTCSVDAIIKTVNSSDGDCFRTANVPGVDAIPLTGKKVGNVYSYQQLCEVHWRAHDGVPGNIDIQPAWDGMSSPQKCSQLSCRMGYPGGTYTVQDAEPTIVGDGVDCDGDKGRCNLGECVPLA